MRLATSLAALAAATLLPVAAVAAEPASRQVTISFVDLTGTQPSSSSVFVSHKAGTHLWQEGKPAEIGVKRLAEEGNPEWIAGGVVFDSTGAFRDAAIAIPALPGKGRSVTVTVDAEHPFVSGGWMLGMTNDGFAGIDAVDAFHATKPIEVEVYALDAGTRKNAETKASTAGLGGLTEDPENGVVARHTGVRGDADIPASFRFDASKPVGRVTIAPAAQPRT